MEQGQDRDIAFSWKLRAGSNGDDRYIKILASHREYGYSTMTKLVAAALNEYAERHPLDVASFNYGDIV